METKIVIAKKDPEFILYMNSDDRLALIAALRNSYSAMYKHKQAQLLHILLNPTED